MKKITTVLLALLIYSNGIAQKITKSTTESLMKELAENSFRCIDSITIYNKSTYQVSKEISNCIDEQSGALQLGKKLLSTEDLKTKKIKRLKNKLISQLTPTKILKNTSNPTTN